MWAKVCLIFVASGVIAWGIKLSAPVLSPLIASVSETQQNVYSMLAISLPVLLLAVILSLGTKP